MEEQTNVAITIGHLPYCRVLIQNSHFIALNYITFITITIKEIFIPVIFLFISNKILTQCFILSHIFEIHLIGVARLLITLIYTRTFMAKMTVLSIIRVNMPYSKAREVTNHQILYCHRALGM